jgi:hypothetical protein
MWVNNYLHLDDLVQIDSMFLKPYVICFYNYLGEKVLEQYLNNRINSISLEKIEDGIYFIQVLSNADVLKTEKLIIIR